MSRACSLVSNPGFSTVTQNNRSCGVTLAVIPNAPFASVVVVFGVSHCVTRPPGTGLSVVSRTRPATRSGCVTRADGAGVGLLAGAAIAVGADDAGWPPQPEANTTWTSGNRERNPQPDIERLAADLITRR